MANQIRVADLPNAEVVDGQSYVIIEKPGLGQGTYKSTVRNLQNAITVKAEVTDTEESTKIEVTDIDGTTESTIVKPIAHIHDNGDGTCTITMRDASGVTTETIVQSVIIDPIPTEDSNHMVSSGTVFTVNKNLQENIDSLENKMNWIDFNSTS